MSETEAFVDIFGEAPASPNPAASSAPELAPTPASTGPPAGARGPEPATAAPELGAAATEQQAEPAPSTAPAPAEDIYARRRKQLTRIVLLVVVIGGFALWHLKSQVALPGAGTALPAAATAAPTPAAQQSATAQIDALLATAQRWHATHASYAGWTTSAVGFAAAASANEVVVTADISGICYYSGIIPGQPTRVLSSPKACEPGALAQVQQSLDAEAAATAAADTQVLTARLESAATAAAYWATAHVGARGPSFAGLPALAGIAATVDNAGARVTLTARGADGSCLAETLTTASPNSATPGAC